MATLAFNELMLEAQFDDDLLNLFMIVFSELLTDWGRWGCAGGHKGPLPKICHTYSTMMNLAQLYLT